MSVKEHDMTMRQLEEGVRKGLERFMLMMLFVCLSLEIGLGIYFFVTDTLYQPVTTYAILRVLLPCAINLSLYFVMFYANRSALFDDTVKNRCCSTAFLMFLGELSIIHSYFVPLWMLSYFMLMFSGIFHDSKFHKIQAVLCQFFVLAAGFSHYVDYPDDLSHTIEYVIVAEAVGFALCVFAFELERFSSMEFLINMETTEGARRYKAGYEFDSLTGVFSRAHLEESAHSIFNGMNNNYGHVGVAMIDIDDFKHVNDTYGHDNGDVVLRKLGEYLVRFNTTDIICGRYGGEEFVIIFKHADRDENIYELDSLRKLFSETSYPFSDKAITLSIGYNVARSDAEWDSALKAADEALYESKRTGKNKITVKE